MATYRSVRDRKVSCVRPIVVGIAVTVVSILLIIGIASLIFSIIESIARGAIVPVAFAALAFGCFAGGYTCAVSVGKGGVICGAVIGIAAALLVIIAGCFGDGFNIGKMAFAKFAVMVASGCCGGYIGMNRRCCRRGR